MAATKHEETPMKRQYNILKEKHKDCILFFRLGDFYEMFDEDAKIAARELDLTLTTRDRGKPKEEQTPMCGVPFHSAESYIGRLVNKGYKVALCEQMEDPAKAKGLVERDVTRIYTPGTLLETVMLKDRVNNYIACIYADGGRIGIASCDISTGCFFVTVCDDEASALADLGRMQPVEVLRGGKASRSDAINELLIKRIGCCINEVPDSHFNLSLGENLLPNHFKKDLAAMNLTGRPEAIIAGGVLLQALYDLQKNDLRQINVLYYYSNSFYMELDPDARRNLELTETLRSKEKRGSLLWVLDKTRTAMGGRMLRSWLERPLLGPAEITRRNEAVELFSKEPVLRDDLTELFKSIPDLERITARTSAGLVNGRELQTLAMGLRQLPAICKLLQGNQLPMLFRLMTDFDTLEDCAARIEQTLQDEPPLTIREGGLIRPGFSQEVDRLRDIMNGGKDTILAIENAEREKTGIRTLKVGYNRVFGYYIEVSKSFMDQVPAHYIRKQTLANNERYITPELKELEEQVLTAKDRVTALEYELFCQLREYVAQQTTRLQEAARKVATLDCLCSLGLVAARNNYVRPNVELSNSISIVDGRHPVVEQMLTDSLFVPNSTYLDTNEHQVAIITGPNMAGKSTYMRQVALIVLMAQIGSMVPARSATIGIVDRVFTRIGASDDLGSGQSTFMVEMTEVANILKHATSKSLLILDEIGRGTSTYDGMSIARAVLEYVASPKRLGAKALFATHYHELSAIEQELSNVKNFNIAVKKRDDKMIFLRKIVSGSTDDSYGIEVAKLAGIPEPVIKRARQILKELETQQPRPVRESVEEPDDQVSMLDMAGQRVTQELQNLALDTISPIEAMNFLYRLKNMLN